MSDIEVGCWIRNANDPEEIGKVSFYSEGESNYPRGCYYTSVGDDTAIIENAELWKPKKGDLCWFWTDKSVLPILTRFDYHKGDTYWTDGGTKQEFWGFTHCEPFIGNVPKLLKDKEW